MPPAVKRISGYSYITEVLNASAREKDTFVKPGPDDDKAIFGERADKSPRKKDALVEQKSPSLPLKRTLGHNHKVGKLDESMRTKAEFPKVVLDDGKILLPRTTQEQRNYLDILRYNDNIALLKRTEQELSDFILSSEIDEDIKKSLMARVRMLHRGLDGLRSEIDSLPDGIQQGILTRLKPLAERLDEIVDARQLVSEPPAFPTREELQTEGRLYSQAVATASEEGRSITIIDHLRNVWMPWIEAGVLTRAELRRVDMAAYTELSKWARKPGNDLRVALEGYDVPTRSEVARSGLTPELVKRAERINALARRSRITESRKAALSTLLESLSVPPLPTEDELRATGDLYSQAVARANAEGHSITIIDHLRRVWMPWIEAGVVSKPELLNRDHSTYHALQRWTRKHGSDLASKLGYDIPSKSAMLERSLGEVERLEDPPSSIGRPESTGRRVIER